MIKKINKSEEELLTPKQMDLQEALTIERLKKLEVIGKSKVSEIRPKDNYIDLLGWIERNFGSFIGYPDEAISKLIHNSIGMDGNFILYCEENDVNVTCLHNEAIASWLSDQGNERFFMQGVFLISKGKMKFILATLLHKDSDNDDEMSLSILVNNNDFESYINLRNDYDEWASKRNRGNLHVMVMDGEDIPYSKDASWNDLFLPEELKNSIRISVEGFLKSKEFYEEKKLPWKRGMLLHGLPGCGKTSVIKTIISNYDFKPVTVTPGADDEALQDAFAYAETQSPALLYFEDLDSLLNGVNASLFLNLTDGIATKNGLLIIGTANNIDQIKSNIKERPSRFDRIFHIPLPDKHMSFLYLKKWYGSSIKDGELKDAAEFMTNYGFSYAYIKEVYLSSAYLAMSKDRKNITSQDIQTALKQIIEDKFKKSSKQIGLDKYITRK